jgi:hypothetical protein
MNLDERLYGSDAVTRIFDEHGLLVALIVAAACLLGAMFFVAYRAPHKDWRDYQHQFLDLEQVDPETPLGIRQVVSCTGTLERCTTCHMGMDRKDLRADTIALPLRGHGPHSGKHEFEHIGCTACHGGTGRALKTPIAHMSSSLDMEDPLRREPHIQASCARCHVPGAHTGQERLVQGAELYLGLGCALCHPLEREGVGGDDFGPDLKAIGRRSPAFLEKSLIDPQANFVGSTMPSFELALEDELAAATSLIVYLESLVMPKALECGDWKESAGLVNQPCATCHAGPGGTAGGRMEHLCVYIKNRASELRCKNCHGEGIPKLGAGAGYCPLVKQMRSACNACHAGEL